MGPSGWGSETGWCAWNPKEQGAEAHGYPTRISENAHYRGLRAGEQTASQRNLTCVDNPSLLNEHGQG